MRTIHVDKCVNQCPYWFPDAVSKWGYCTHPYSIKYREDNRTILDRVKTFPKWCPLKDEEETGVEYALRSFRGLKEYNKRQMKGE